VSFFIFLSRALTFLSCLTRFIAICYQIKQTTNMSFKQLPIIPLLFYFLSVTGYLNTSCNFLCSKFKDEIYLFNFVLLKKKRSDRIIFFFYINRHELTSWTNAIRLTLWEEKLQGGTINADDIRLKLWEEKFQDSNIAAIRLKTLSRGSYKMCLNSQ
jgi:hypothetical protein